MGELKNKGREGVKENQDKYQEIHEGAEQSLEERNRNIEIVHSLEGVDDDDKASIEDSKEQGKEIADQIAESQMETPKNEVNSRMESTVSEATVIINMDLLARIELARSNRLLQTEQLISSNSTEEKKKIIRLIRDTHNAYFEAYSRYSVERFDYQIILINFYMQYLDSITNTLKKVHIIISSILNRSNIFIINFF